MKRFTETTKWSDPWYRGLSPTSKCLWQYLCDNCDAAGVIDLDIDLASFQIGAKVKDQNLKELGERIARLPNGKWWLTKFVPFQYGRLSPDCKAHGPALKSLEENHCDQTLPKGYPNPFERVQEKEKEKETVQETETPKGIELPASLDTADFRKAWDEWANYRKQAKLKPYTAIGAEKQIQALEIIGPARAIAAINRSIAQGWQGIHESNDKPNGANKPNPRVIGTRNEGTSAQYKGIGRIVPSAGSANAENDQ